MGRGFHKSIQSYISKLKKPNQPTTPNNTATTTNTTTTSCKLLFACRKPKTASFAGGRAATLSDVDRFLFENFNSLYIDDEEDIGNLDVGVPNPNYDPMASPEYAVEALPEIKATERFFVSPRTMSGSLMEEAHESASSSTSVGLSEDSVIALAFSKDPCDDFRRSMEEMVEARRVGEVDVDGRSEPLDWEFMEDLLFCYLELNDRSVHKYILEAFSDVTASLRRRWQKSVDVKGDAVVSPSPACR